MAGDEEGLNWRRWFKQYGLTPLCDFSDDVWEQPWAPTDADAKAAWELYTEMRTRISTQPLHYRSGVEKTALESIVQLFRVTRELLRKHGPECRHFATIAVEVLNVRIRPFTARWHGLSKSGRLRTDDGRHLFRGELLKLQGTLRKFQKLLGQMAEGSAFVVGTESGFRPINERRISLGDSIPFDKLQGLPLAGGAGRPPQELLDKERQEVAARRRAVGLAGTDDLVGLAISGGGIRSATFAQGVLQGIAVRGLLKEIDFLSSVSGGGYIASFLSSYLNDADTPGTSCSDVGLGANQLPFERKDQCESAPMRYLRNHSKYLLPVGFIGRLTMICQGLYGVLMNLVIILPLLTGALLLTRYYLLDAMEAAAAAVRENQAFALLLGTYDVTLCIALIWVALVVLLALVQKLTRVVTSRLVRSAYETFCVWTFAALLLVALVESIPLGYYGFLKLNKSLGLLGSNLSFQPSAIWLLLGNLATFLSARGLLVHQKDAGAAIKARVSALRKVVFLLLAMAGPLLLVVTYLLLCHGLVNWRPAAGELPTLPLIGVSISRDIFLWGLFLLPAAYSFLLLNINLISPQRYYRNRLAATYLLKPVGQSRKVAAVDPQLLSDLGRTQKAPYHLINAALNIPASQVAELRGRNADFFLFSKHYCGSPVTGYFDTREWESVDGYLNLGTAVAISGAAASPQMGTTTPHGLSFFLTLLNIRLGYWLRRPDVFSRPAPLIKAFDAPGPTYLFREMFGWIAERSEFLKPLGIRPRFLNVSDGGHIENLAVYELLRRRCKFIVAIDGECDPRLEFPSLMKLQQYAWIDFGTSIELELDRLRLTDRGWSQAHIGFAKITYHSGEHGFLLYIKLSMTGNERDYLLDYRARNSPFPHQSTLDQLFDEAQFEAYRALGEHVADDLFSEEFLGTFERPLTVRNWFQALAQNLVPDVERVPHDEVPH